MSTNNNSSPQVGQFKTKSHLSKDPVIQYICDNSLRLTDIQKELIQVTCSHSMAKMLGSADEVQLLQNLLRLIGAHKVLEIGVYTGYTTMSLAMVLPDDGKVVGCDISEEYTDIGKPFWKKAGVDHKIDLKIGKASETLQNLIDAGESGSYDFAFIDADKTGMSDYYEQCLQLVRSGGIVALDNVLWSEKVVDPNVTDKDTEAIRAVTRKVHADPRVNVSMLRVGDGTTLAFKR